MAQPIGHHAAHAHQSPPPAPARRSRGFAPAPCRSRRSGRPTPRRAGSRRSHAGRSRRGRSARPPPAPAPRARRRPGSRSTSEGACGHGRRGRAPARRGCRRSPADAPQPEAGVKTAGRAGATSAGRGVGVERAERRGGAGLGPRGDRPDLLASAAAPGAAGRREQQQGVARGARARRPVTQSGKGAEDVQRYRDFVPKASVGGQAGPGEGSGR